MEHLVIYAFSAFLFMGAYFGFKAGSKISVMMGLLTGALIVLGDMLYRYNAKAGLLFLLIVSGVLVIMFVQRVLQTHKMMPSGMLLIISTLFFIFILSKYLK